MRGKYVGRMRDARRRRIEVGSISRGERKKKGRGKIEDINKGEEKTQARRKGKKEIQRNKMDGRMREMASPDL